MTAANVAAARRVAVPQTAALQREQADHRVTVEIDGHAFGGWKGVSIRRSMLEASSSWSVAASLGWQGEDNPYRVQVGSSAKVRIGRNLVITGYVDVVGVDYDSTSLNVDLSGRSKTADLVDCSAAPGARNARGFWDLARKLAAPYGVTVRAVAQVRRHIKRHYTRPGATVFQELERLSRRSRVLLTDNEDGDLVFTQSTHATRAHTALVYGQNILTGSIVSDASQRFTEYRCRGQQIEDDESTADALAAVEGIETDNALQRFRLHTFRPEYPVDRAGAKERAQWEAATRSGKSLQVVYEVAGWRQGNGQLWAPNTLVSVSDPIGNINGDMLLVAVTYTDDESGTRAALELAPPAAYKPLPIRRGYGGAWKELRGGVTAPRAPQ